MTRKTRDANGYLLDGRAALSGWRATSAERRLLGIVVGARKERAGVWRNTILDDETTVGDESGARGDLSIVFMGSLGRYHLGDTGDGHRHARRVSRSLGATAATLYTRNR